MKESPKLEIVFTLKEFFSEINHAKLVISRLYQLSLMIINVVIWCLDNTQW